LEKVKIKANSGSKNFVVITELDICKNYFCYYLILRMSFRKFTRNERKNISKLAEK
jgi:hypothetical protein